VADLDSEIRSYEAMLPKLEAEYMDRWVLIHDGALIGAFESFDSAADEAYRRFGAGPYLIRQVGADPDDPLPISAIFPWPNAQN
jgi:hypothetical protein